MEKLHQAWFSPHSNYLSQVPRSSWLYVTFLFGLPLQFAAQSEKKLKLLSFFMIELSLVEYEMRKFCLSMLAAAAIYTAQCTMNGFKSWNKCCKLHTKYFFMTLMILIKKYFINLLQQAWLTMSASGSSAPMWSMKRRPAKGGVWSKL